MEVQVKARMSDSKRVQSGGFVAFVRLQTCRAQADPEHALRGHRHRPQRS